MNHRIALLRPAFAGLAILLLLAAPPAMSADASVNKELLDILLENGAISQEQYDRLLSKVEISAEDVLAQDEAGSEAATEADPTIAAAVEAEVNKRLESEPSVKANHGSSGFRLETRDGNWQTNLQWRAQLRYSNPTDSDPRQIDDFEESGASSFEPRRLRMKIGGHGYQPWLKYYFEVDLQPARDVDASSSSSGARVIDWRIDLAKWDWGGIRVGQWKIDLNRERVDSSGRQQFVERSIVNRVFTVDRQIGIQARGDGCRPQLVCRHFQWRGSRRPKSDRRSSVHGTPAMELPRS